MRTVVLTALLVALGATPAAARGKSPPKLEVNLTVKRKRVALLDEVPLVIQVKNKGRRPVLVPPLRLSDDAITIVLKDGSKEFRLRRLHGRWVGGADGKMTLQPEVMTRTKLRPSRKVTETLSIIAIRPGTYAVAVELNGIEGLDDPVVSRSPELVVTPPADGKRLQAIIRTSFGSMKATLFPDDAYNTCHEIVLNARNRFYGNGMVFFRVKEDFMAQVGCPANDGTKGYGYSVPGEINDHSHVRGVLSMAHKGHVDSANGQLFIMHGDTPGLDGKYTAFGKLLDGFGVLDRIVSVRKGPNPHRPTEISRPEERIELYGIDLALVKPEPAPPPK